MDSTRERIFATKEAKKHLCIEVIRLLIGMTDDLGERLTLVHK